MYHGNYNTGKHRYLKLGMTSTKLGPGVLRYPKRLSSFDPMKLRSVNLILYVSGLVVDFDISRIFKISHV